MVPSTNHEVLTMGLDLALGAIILIGAIRGWLKGFVAQAVRLGGFVACIYLAAPVREQARPHVAGRLPTIDPALLDRILWWVAAIVSYVVLVGLVTLALSLLKTPPQPGMPRSRRDDQFGGFLLGAAKGLLVAAFAAAGVMKYGEGLTSNLPWAGRQTEGSYALKWTEQYQPVPRIWSAPPVRRFVEHIQRNGLRNLPESDLTKQVAEKSDDSAAAPPRMELAPEEQSPAVDPPVGLDPDVVQELERYRQELGRRSGPR